MYKLMNQVVLSNGQYSHCVTIDRMPSEDELKTLVKVVLHKKNSPFQGRATCIFAIQNPEKDEWLKLNDITILFSHLIKNGWTIHTDITKMMKDKDVICYVSKLI